MKKKLTLVIAAILLMSGCGADTSDSGDDTLSSQKTEQKTEVTAAEILDKLMASGKAEKMTARADFGSEDFNSMCDLMYGVTLDSLTDGGVIFEETGQSADEVSLLKGADESVLKSRAEQRAAVYDGYAPEEAEKARNALVFTYEGFSVLVIADNAAEIKDIITKE